MNNLKEAFGLRLREIRKIRQYTQEELAEMLELSPRQLIRIENGENFPSSETLGKLSLLLNVRLETMFDFIWNEDAMYFSTGTYNKPSIKVVKKSCNATIKPFLASESSILKAPVFLQYDEVSSYLSDLAKTKKMQIVVDFFENKIRFAIKIFNPNGKIEDILSKDDICANEQYRAVVEQIKKISKDINKLNFVKLAIDSMENKEDLRKLKMLIQGMELTSQ